MQDELHPKKLTHAKMGTVSMANAGENTSSSPFHPPRQRSLRAWARSRALASALRCRNCCQFFITSKDDLTYLDGKHTVFGQALPPPARATRPLHSLRLQRYAEWLGSLGFRLLAHVSTQVAEGLDVVSEINLAYTDDNKRPERSLRASSDAKAGQRLGRYPGAVVGRSQGRCGLVLAM